MLYFYMKQKTAMFVFIFALLISIFNNSAFASGFVLKSIGSVETGGQQISHWWYTSTNPTFHGEAAANASIEADVDGNKQSITADSAGAWEYNPGSLTEGDHTVTFTSAGTTINFTLTLGVENVDWNAVGSGSASTLPATGNLTPTILLVLGGLGIIGLGGKMVLNVNKN